MDFVEQLKSSVDIVEVVGQYVRLKKSGAGPRYTGKCPFHTEKTPSFSVHAGHQFYKCFGCGVGGDVIKFVMEIERLSFYEALKLLSERYGIPMPRRSEYSDPETKLRAAIYRIHELAAQAFRNQLRSSGGAEARAYLTKRGLSPDLIEEFGLGYSERGGQSLVRLFEREGMDAEQMEASGLVLKREQGGFFDRFRDRLMFPIHNESGKVIGFGGRALAKDQEPKYLNSPETAIYRKSYVMYNLHRAKEAVRKNERVLLVEGYMDVIGVWSAGVHEVVASCGTSLTTQQVKSLSRHSDRIVVNYDPDAAGQNATERSLQILLEEGLRVRVLELEGGLDPDEYVKENGADVYRSRVENAPGYFHWLADRTRKRFDMSSAEGRVAGLKYLLPAIQRLSDKLERAAVANDVAAYLNVEQDLVLEHFRRAATERRPEDLAPSRPTLRPLERLLLRCLLESEEARAEVLPRLRESAAYEQFTARRIFEALAAAQAGEGRVSYADLEARLQDRDKELLAAALLTEDVHAPQEDVLDQARACLRQIEIADREAARSNLRRQVQLAEKAGDLQGAMRLMQELARLERG